MTSSIGASSPARDISAFPAAQRSLPKRIGPWQPVRWIADGAIFQVYQARPVDVSASGRPCYAVKVLNSACHDRSDALELLRREAVVGTTVSDPQLVCVLDCSLKEPPYYLAMPWIAGSNLADVLVRQGSLATPTALWIARQVAQALAALHRSGWMHSDVKPENIVVAPDGHATLIDLAFAQSSRQQRSAAERPVAGTANYMAPEMFTSALAADIRSDIYSLGITLYEMLTGQLPYEGRNPAEVAALQRDGVPDRLRCLAPLLPMEIVTLVRQMIAKEPLRRPQTPDELLERLVALEIQSLGDRIESMSGE